ncbi:MAG: hypothetical protein K0R15_186 [Clostridiales bacterium]|jgi:uncharacterized membrane protein YhiD involved in acid resistance|nr:hypothetical protein [Clostridiales bacterium]
MNNAAVKFKDILEEGFMGKQQASQLDIVYVLTVLGITLIIGLFIFLIYRLTYQGVIYSHAYNMAILAISLVTALVIMTISSNVVLSLGMVGALSIVRFRTAIKEPMDIVYMFWSLVVGITAGAGLFYVAVAGSLFIGCVIVILSIFKTSKKSYMLIAYYHNSCEEAVNNALQGITYVIKSKTLTKDQIELTLKVKVRNNNTDFVKTINDIDKVQSVSLVNFEENYL